MRTFVIAALLLCTAVGASAFQKGAEGCSGDCLGCHKLTMNEAAQIVKSFDQSVTVTGITQSPVRGLFQVSVRKDKSQGTVFIDFSKHYLVQGTIVDIRNKKAAASSSMPEHKPVNVSKISLKHAMVMGNPGGKTKLYVLSDPECPYCGKLHDELKKLAQEMPDLKIYILLFGLDMHPNAAGKAQSIICRSKDDPIDALKMLEDSYARHNIKSVPCVENGAEANKRLAKELDIHGTPAVILPGGKVIMGFKTKDELKALLK